MGPGTLSTYGPWLRRPHGRVHWAGTETSTYWTGYMDGAVRAGQRAAAEVLTHL
jgi:monoamine oxidase